MGVKDKDLILSGPGVKFQICKSRNRSSLSVSYRVTYKRGCNGSEAKHLFSETGLGHWKEGRGSILLDKFL